MSERWELALRRELAEDALFDEGVEAARNACVAGASIAAAAITAAAFYDNPLTGIGALGACMLGLAGAPTELDAFRGVLSRRTRLSALDPEFSPGFGFVSEAQAAAVRAACRRLLEPAELQDFPRIALFFERRAELEAAAGGALNAAGLAALAFLDRGVTPELAQRRFLLWRVETAMAEAERTRRAGLGAISFLTEQYVYDGPRPPARAFDAAELRRRVGLD